MQPVSDTEPLSLSLVNGVSSEQANKHCLISLRRKLCYAQLGCNIGVESEYTSDMHWVDGSYLYPCSIHYVILNQQASRPDGALRTIASWYPLPYWCFTHHGSNPESLHVESILTTADRQLYDSSRLVLSVILLLLYYYWLNPYPAFRSSFRHRFPVPTIVKLLGQIPKRHIRKSIEASYPKV